MCSSQGGDGDTGDLCVRKKELEEQGQSVCEEECSGESNGVRESENMAEQPAGRS